MLCDVAGLWAFFAGGLLLLGVVPILHFPYNDLAKNLYVLVDQVLGVIIRTDK